MNTRFLRCKHCGNIVGVIHDAGVPIFCCGQPMEELTPNTVEASGEKHVPVASVENGVLTVQVGSVEHPMAPEHFIMWIYVKTENGGHRIQLKPGDAPRAVFHLGDEKPVAVYAYCNLHGLWMTEL